MRKFLIGFLVGTFFGVALLHQFNLKNKLKNGDARYILDSQTGKVVLREYK